MSSVEIIISLSILFICGCFYLVRKHFKRVCCWLAGHYGLVTILSGVIIAIFGAWSQFPKINIYGFRPDDQILFWGMVVAYLTSTLISVIKSKADKYKIEEISKQNEDRIKYFRDSLFDERMESLEDHLREISDGLHFTMQERICVYRYIDDENQFECISRYSLHHDYNQFSIRKKYPTDMGIIAHVWKNAGLNGFKRDNTIPVKSDSAKKYFKYLKDTYSIPTNVSKHFRMNPVDIIAEVIRDTKDKAIAIIVFESQRKDFLSVEEIKKIYNDFKRKVIIASLDKLKEQHTPDPNLAKEAQL